MDVFAKPGIWESRIKFNLLVEGPVVIQGLTCARKRARTFCIHIVMRFASARSYCKLGGARIQTNTIFNYTMYIEIQYENASAKLLNFELRPFFQKNSHSQLLFCCFFNVYRTLNIYLFHPKTSNTLPSITHSSFQHALPSAPWQFQPLYHMGII